MGYCEVADVQRLNPQRDYGGTGSALNNPDIQEIIDDIAREIDERLRAVRFTLPIVLADSPIASAMLSVVNALGAAAIAEDSVFMQSIPDQSTHGEVLREQYQGLLDQICGGTLRLGDAEGGPLYISDIAMSGSSELKEDGSEREPFFTRDQVF